MVFVLYDNSVIFFPRNVEYYTIIDINTFNLYNSTTESFEKSYFLIDTNDNIYVGISTAIKKLRNHLNR